MSRPRPDRRVRRTKQRLKEALLQLIEEREYDSITIDEIAARADIGRSTFYSHFRSKEDLLFAGFEPWLLSLAGAGPGDPKGPPPEGARDVKGPPGPEGAGDAKARPAPFRFSLPLLRHIRSQKRFFQATIVRGSDVRLRQKITSLLAEPVRHELGLRSGAAGDGTDHARPGGLAAWAAQEAYVHAVVGALLGLVSWWLASAEELGPEEVDRIFQRAVGR